MYSSQLMRILKQEENMVGYHLQSTEVERVNHDEMTMH